jgi:transcriptional regulator with XRE-family HTH domain
MSWFADILRHAMQTRGLTQSQLARLLDISRQDMSRYLNNSIPSSADRIEDIINRLGGDLRRVYTTATATNQQLLDDNRRLRQLLTAIHQLTADALEDTTTPAHRAPLAADPSTPYGKPPG